MIDPDELAAAKAAFDFLREVPGLALHARTDGGEYHGPCPRCGGVDRFVAWPRHPKGPRAWCRQCHEEVMDPVAFLEWRDGLSFAAACERLGARPVAPRPVAFYSYHDEIGRLLYQIVRYAPKSFRGRRPRAGMGHPPRDDVDTDWEWNLDQTPRVLYRLPAVLGAGPDDVVWLVEGEKDADALAALGLIATTNPHGAGKWRPEYSTALAGRAVVFVPDGDPPGQAHRDLVLPQLLEAGARVKVLALPGAKDVSAWLDAGGTLEALQELARAAPRAGAARASPGRFHFLDLAALAALPPPTWLIADVLVRGGLACLYGPSGVGKSFFALDWALSVASGSAWDGRAVAPGPVVYLAAEGAGGLAQRVAAWQVAHPEAAPGPLWILPEAVNLIEEGLPAALAAELPAAHPALIVVDTLARSMIGGDENTARDMGLMIAAADSLRRTTGATVLLVHHTGKSGDGERGSSALRAACDTMIGLVPGADDDGRVLLECNKQKDAEPFARTAWRRQRVDAAGSCVVARAADVADDSPTLRERERTVLAALCEPVFQHGATLAELRDATQLPNWAIFRVLNRLVALHYAVESGIKKTTTRRHKATAAGYRLLDLVPPWERALAAGVAAFSGEERPAPAVVAPDGQGVTAAGSTASDTPAPTPQARMSRDEQGVTADEHPSDTPAPGVTSSYGVLRTVTASHSVSADNDGDVSRPNPWGLPPATAPALPHEPCPRCGEWHYAWLRTGGWATLCQMPPGTPPPPGDEGRAPPGYANGYYPTEEVPP